MVEKDLRALVQFPYTKCQSKQPSTQLKNVPLAQLSSIRAIFYTTLHRKKIVQ